MSTIKPANNRDNLINDNGDANSCCHSQSVDECDPSTTHPNDCPYTSLDNHQTAETERGSTNGINGDCIAPSANETTSEKNYSTTQVRIILALTTILSNVVYASDTVLAQYLLDKWSDENGHDKSQNHSGPDRGLCDRNESDPWVIHKDRVQARVAVALMRYSFATCFPAFLSCLVFGALVDLIGRRPAMISTLVGYTGKVAIVIVVIRFNLDPNFLFLSYACDGICGGYYLNLMTCYSITADISEQKSSRILGIAILNVIGEITFASINIAIGLLIKNVGYLAASYFILAPVAIALIITILFLPETLPVQKQKLSLKKLWDYTTRIVSLYCKDEDKRRRMSLVFSLLIFFTSVANTVNLSSTDTLYQKHQPFCWNSAQIGYYQAYRHAFGYIAAFGFLCICRCIGCVSDEVLSMVGMLFMAGSFTLETFVTNTWQMYMVPLLMFPGLNLTPIMRGVMSVLAGPDKQGVLFSSIALIEVMCSLVSNVVYNKIYAVTVDVMTGFVYLVMAGMCLVTFVLYIPFFHFYNRRSWNYGILRQSQEDNDSSSVRSSTSSSKGEVS